MSLKPTRVAMITSCWNRAKYLPRFLAALRTLHVGGTELDWFFAYGRSQDCTLPMLQKPDLTFRHHIVSKNDPVTPNCVGAFSGIAEAQNLVRRHIDNNYGTGYFDFIGYVDADVIIPPDYFTRLLPCFDNPCYAAVFGWGSWKNESLRRMEELRLGANQRDTWESPICGGGSTIYRESLFGDHDEKFIRRSDTDFILSITKGRRDYYKTLYVNVGMIHLHEMSIWRSLTSHSFTRGVYHAPLVLKHSDYFGKPYSRRNDLAYLAIILDFPLTVLFFAQVVPWWLGIWSIVGFAVLVSWSMIRLRKELAFSLYDTVREFTFRFGLLCGLIKFGVFRKLRNRDATQSS